MRMSGSKKQYKVSAPAKLILSGEHSVVYGFPAIIAAIDLRLSMEAKGKKKIVKSNIPIGCGLGSSAAYAAAASALRAKNWNFENINRQAYKMEKRQHGNPSGVDNTASVYGGLLWYRKEAEGLKTFSPIKVIGKLPRFFLINTGKPKESTKDMVLKVAVLKKKNPREVVRILSAMEAVTRKLLQYFLAEAKYDISDLIKQNQRLLEKLGVVSPSTKKLIRKIEKIGGAAKISGAGGRKDKSGIIIVYHHNPEKLIQFAKLNKLEIIQVKLGEEGVRIEK